MEPARSKNHFPKVIFDQFIALPFIVLFGITYLSYAVITIPLQHDKSLGIALFGWGVLDYPIISPEP